MKWLKTKMFEPNVFGYLPSLGLKMMTVRSYISILCDSRWEKFGDIRNNLFVQTGAELWIISPSTILRLWNVCAEERTRQVKECDRFSRRCFAGSEV